MPGKRLLVPTPVHSSSKWESGLLRVFFWNSMSTEWSSVAAIHSLRSYHIRTYRLGAAGHEI